MSKIQQSADVIERVLRDDQVLSDLCEGIQQLRNRLDLYESRLNSLQERLEKRQKKSGAVEYVR